MLSVATTVAVIAAFSTYPGFGDRAPTVPRPASNPRVEATIDKGPIVELIVRCQSGTTIISFSKLEWLYCGPKAACARDLSAVVARSCR